MAQSSPAALQLMARMAASPTAVTIEYQAANHGPQPVFLFDILHGDFANGAFPLDHGGYVEFVGDTALVSRKLFPVPAGMLVETRNIPFATRVMPGTHVLGSLTLPLPLTMRDPYRDHAISHQAETCTVRFQLGYFIGAPQTETQGRMFPTDHGEHPGFDVFGEERQMLATSDPLGEVLCAGVIHHG